MKLELEISESEDYSEFPAEETVEQRPLCYNCKRKTTTVGLCVKKKRRQLKQFLGKCGERERESYQIYNRSEFRKSIKMPAKPPKMPKDATQEQLDEYSQKLEKYFKDREKDLADQQLESDRTLAELLKEKTNIELKERETVELQAELEKSMAELDLKKQSHEDVWKEEADKLDRRRIELAEERRRLEKLAIEIENNKGAGGGRGRDEMLKFMQQQQDLLTRITSLEEKREIRESEESERLKLKDSIGRGVKPPIFRGDKGERPEAHILRAEDWMEASNPSMTNAMKVRNFKLTLDHLAREWYDNADSKGDYEKLKGDFSRHFSTQGKSVRNLHARWNSFTFDPATDDIEVFLRNVQETAKQLDYKEATVVNMIKSKMPLAMYSTLYDIHDLDKVVTSCRDIYAKSIDATAESSNATGGAAAANPFSAMKDEFFFMDDGAVNAQKQKPFKPHVTAQGRGKKKGRGGSRGGKGRGGQQKSNNPRQNNFNR